MELLLYDIVDVVRAPAVEAPHRVGIMPRLCIKGKWCHKTKTNEANFKL